MADLSESSHAFALQFATTSGRVCVVGVEIHGWLHSFHIRPVKAQWKDTGEEFPVEQLGPKTFAFVKRRAAEELATEKAKGVKKIPNTQRIWN